MVSPTSVNGFMTPARPLAAVQGLEQAEAVEQTARQRLATAPDRGRLQQVLIDHDERTRLAERLVALRVEREAARTAVQAATAKVTSSREAVTAARSKFEHARSTRTAAELRQHLVDGEECPVCAQQVLTLPPPLTIPKGEEAAVAKAEKALDLAQSRLATASNAETVKDVEVGETSARISRLDTALNGQPSERADIIAAIGELERLTSRAEEASRAVSDAHRLERQATRNVADLARQSAHAAAEFAKAHGPLTAWGAPELDHADLPAAWAGLTGWAAAQRHSARQRRVAIGCRRADVRGQQAA